MVASEYQFQGLNWMCNPIALSDTKGVFLAEGRHSFL
jgi:hypothetical protein